MWRNTAFPVRVLFLDARACLPVLAFIVYWRWWTFYIAITGMSFFMVISWFGLTVPAFFRLLRRLIVGPMRPAVPAWRRRRLA
jgi:intracellular multiplication protein IcmT